MTFSEPPPLAKGKRKRLDSEASEPVVSRKRCRPSSSAAASVISPRPFWNEDSLTASHVLWLPTSDGCVSRTGWQSSGSSFQRLGQNAWFSAEIYGQDPNQPMPDSRFRELYTEVRPNNKTVKVRKIVTKVKKAAADPGAISLKKPPAARCHTIRLYPTSEQKDILRKWMGAVRWTYNQCVQLVCVERKVSNNLKELRAALVNLDSPAVVANPWLKDTPYDIRDEGVRDFVKAVEINKMKGERFRMQFRSRKDPSDTMVLHAKHWRGNSMIFNHWRGTELKSAEPIPSSLGYDSRIQRLRTGQYYMRIPMARSVWGENQAPAISQPSAQHSCAIDPGVRTFITCYDPFGQQIVEFGRRDMARIFRLAHTSDDLISRMTRAKARKRYTYRRAMLRNNQKIRFLVKDLHRKTAKFLCENYMNIMIPVFETQKMVSRKHARKIHSKTARSMITWSHYQFRQHLDHKASEYSGRNILSVTEEYTSKTCSACGHLHQTLGGNKTFRCPSCSYKTDRDWNGARNIYLKNMSLLFTGRRWGLPPFERKFDCNIY